MMDSIKVTGISTCFIWVHAHVGVEGHYKVVILAKQTLKNKASRSTSPIDKAEAKGLIRTY